MKRFTIISRMWESSRLVPVDMEKLRQNAAYSQLTTISCLLMFNPPQSLATCGELILTSVVLGTSKYADCVVNQCVT